LALALGGGVSWSAAKDQRAPQGVLRGARSEFLRVRPLAGGCLIEHFRASLMNARLPAVQFPARRCAPGTPARPPPSLLGTREYAPRALFNDGGKSSKLAASSSA